jgi:hypothetical protein
MKAPLWPRAELIDLHRSFLEMRSRRSVEERRDLSFKIVLRRASMVRLEQSMIECPFCPAELRADVLQEMTLLLAETFAAESLHYSDQGVDQFGSWYWTVCGHACERAARKLRGDELESIVFADE